MHEHMGVLVILASFFWQLQWYLVDQCHDLSVRRTTDF